MVLNIDEDSLLVGLFNQREVVLESLGSRLCDEDVDFALNRIKCNWEMRGVWREDCDRITRIQGIDCGLVGLWITRISGGESSERDIQAVVDISDVLLKMVSLGHVSIYTHIYGYLARHIRIAGNLDPFVPTILRSPTLPRRRRSKRVRPTTPTCWTCS